MNYFAAQDAARKRTGRLVVFFVLAVVGVIAALYLPIAAIASETVFVAGVSALALPLAIAVFPQEMRIATSVLEPEFQHAKDADGKPIEYVLCNKGL